MNDFLPFASDEQMMKTTSLKQSDETIVPTLTQIPQTVRLNEVKESLEEEHNSDWPMKVSS